MCWCPFGKWVKKPTPLNTEQSPGAIKALTNLAAASCPCVPPPSRHTRVHTSIAPCLEGLSLKSLPCYVPKALGFEVMPGKPVFVWQPLVTPWSTCTMRQGHPIAVFAQWEGAAGHSQLQNEEAAAGGWS